MNMRAVVHIQHEQLVCVATGFTLSDSQCMKWQSNCAFQLHFIHPEINSRMEKKKQFFRHCYYLLCTFAHLAALIQFVNSENEYKYNCEWILSSVKRRPEYFYLQNTFSADTDCGILTIAVASMRMRSVWRLRYNFMSKGKANENEFNLYFGI